MADNLADEDTTHWTGAIQPMCGLIRIEGQPYRFMGSDNRVVPHDIPKISLEYLSDAHSIQFTLTFLTPDLPHKLEWMSRPVTYFSYNTFSKNRKLNGL